MRTSDEDGAKFVSHGDCWNNNFMWKHNTKDAALPEKVAIIDWQICGLCSPVFDLSYFLLTCISNEDLQNVDFFLDAYYETFAEFVHDLGSDAGKLYTKDDLFKYWKRYARFGVVMSGMSVKMATTQKEDLPDIAEFAKEGNMKMDGSFSFKGYNKEEFRKRMGAIVQYSVDQDLID